MFLCFLCIVINKSNMNFEDTHNVNIFFHLNGLMSFKRSEVCRNAVFSL